MECIAVETIEPRPEHYQHLERGNVLLFPKLPFAFSEQEKEVLRGTAQSGSKVHKNIAYRPGLDKVTGYDPGAADAAALLAAMRAYSQRALGFLGELLPRYMAAGRVDFASFRPFEEDGRDLPLKKRNDLLHIDAFPTRPTRGDLILRVFTNINRSKPRVWLTSDGFESVAKQYALGAGLREVSASRPVMDRLAHLAAAAGLPVPDRSAYDRFMLGFHDYLKGNDEYQRGCTKYRFEFPPDSTWIVFTDIVPHAVLSGQHALEQTVIVRRQSLLAQHNAPIDILESICQCPLAATSAERNPAHKKDAPASP